MNREQFLTALSDALQNMSEPERITTLKYFAEVIGDRVDAGQTEEEAIAALGTPEEIAARLESEGVFMGTETQRDAPSAAYTEAEQSVQQAFSGIRDMVRIHVFNQPIEVVRGTDSDLHLSFIQLPGERYEIQAENGTFSLVQIKTAKTRNLFKSHKQFVRVVLPAAYDGSADLQSTNSAVRISGGTFDNLRLCSSNGSLHTTELTAQTLRLETTNSALHIVRVGARQLEGRTTNGSIEVTDTVSAGLLHLSTSNGCIRSNGIAGQDVRLQSSNGKICGEIEGIAEEYSVSAHTSNGRSNLQNRKGGAKKLVVVTSNGNISLSFSGKQAPDDGCAPKSAEDEPLDPWFMVDEETGEVLDDEPDEDEYDDDEDDCFDAGNWRDVGQSIEEWGREFSRSMKGFGKDLKHSLQDLERSLRDMFG